MLACEVKDRDHNLREIKDRDRTIGDKVRQNLRPEEAYAWVRAGCSFC